MAWWLDQQAADLAAPGADASPVAFEVRPGEALAAVAARLEAEGLIRDAGAFRLLARVRGLDTQVQAGAFTLRRDMRAEEVLAALMVAAGESVTVTIPEGKRSEEVATLLANLHLVERAEFLRLVGEGALGAAYPAVADRPAGAGLEGYLFPDTYQVDPEAGAEGVLRVLLTTFEARVTPEIRSRAQASGLSLYEVVTLASIVEREAALAIERPKIARVFLNRLAAAPYILNADPTVQYALGFQPEANSWWKRPLYTVDLDVDSAYNTYRNPGLPPGPIASPGLASIEAVVDPEPGPWQYFVANDAACDGSHVFAETFEEHQRNIAQYQTGGCGP
ncbi:MAG: endolytic transglycosylase MltG [Chloroflexi bacterium CFX6]|nr:endolytic transglycosylase MltG [Chloroflexi bacterium CFX6]